MKKRVLCAILVVLLVTLLSFSGCVGNNFDFTPTETNLASDASYTYSNGKTSRKMSLSGSSEKSVVVTLPQKTTFNTLLLKATNNNIDAFEIIIDGNIVYKQDEIGQLRNCWLGEQSASEFTIKVTKSSGSYKIKFLGVYNMPRGGKDFRVSTYLETGTNGERLPSFDKESLNHVDNVILFNSTDFAFTDNGTLAVNTASLTNALNFIRSENPTVNVILCLLPKATKPETTSLEWPLDIAKTHSDAFSINPTAFIAEIKALMTTYNLQGIGFDYEYPQTDSDWKIYSDFVVQLKTAIGDKILSLAIQFFGGDFTPEALKAVDNFEIMCYDFVGKNNAHSTYYEAIPYTLQFLKDAKFDMSRVNIGLPFYSRPTETIGDWNLVRYWGEYKEFASELDKFTNMLDVNRQLEGKDIKTLYFNSYQMIADKTSFCYDYGVGGVMIWNYGSDLPYSNPLSLHRAVNDALGRN